MHRRGHPPISSPIIRSPIKTTTRKWSHPWPRRPSQQRVDASSRVAKAISLSGEPPKGRLVIVQFESMDQLQKWWNNPEWQAAHKKGEQYAKFRDMAIEGVSP